MGRGKLALELIPKEKSRRITFEKRKKGLMKKAEEFSILCGVDTCVLVYGPSAGSNCTAKPEIWPPNEQEITRIIERYRNEGVDRRTKRTTGLPDFFMSRKKKLDAELAKARMANWEAKYPVSEDLINNFASSEEQYRSLLISLGNKLELVKRRIAVLKENARTKMAQEMAMYDSHANNEGYHHHMQSLFTENFMPIHMNTIDFKPPAMMLELPYMHKPFAQAPSFESTSNTKPPMPHECMPFGCSLSGNKMQYPIILNPTANLHALPIDSVPSGDTAIDSGNTFQYHSSSSFPVQNFSFASQESGPLLPESSTYSMPTFGNSNSEACYDAHAQAAMLLQTMPQPRLQFSVMQAGDLSSQPHPLLQGSAPSNQFHDISELLNKSKRRGC